MSFINILFGLGAAATWGAGDFCGGLASKRCSSYLVVLTAQVLGASFLLLLAVGTREPWADPEDMLFGGAAGIAGMLGLLALYTGLSSGRMSVFAPLSAIASVAPPAVAAIVTDGWPPVSTMAGFTLALPAVWLLSCSHGDGERLKASELRLALGAGLCFGLFFVLIDQVGTGAVYWPLVSARASAACLMSICLLARRLLAPPVKPTRQRSPLDWSLALPLVLTGVFDAGGNVFFTLAAQAGRLDVAVVLASLYPGVTVFLAWILLKERLARPQWVGVLGACIALVLIAA